MNLINMPQTISLPRELESQLDELVVLGYATRTHKRVEVGAAICYDWKTGQFSLEEKRSGDTARVSTDHRVSYGGKTSVGFFHWHPSGSSFDPVDIFNLFKFPKDSFSLIQGSGVARFALLKTVQSPLMLLGGADVYLQGQMEHLPPGETPEHQRGRLIRAAFLAYYSGTGLTLLRKQ